MGSLTQDYTTVPGQLYACISLVGPDCPQKNDKFGLKIRGCFNTRDEASSHAQRLQKEDATFDIYVVDMYKWLLIPPDRDHIEDVHYNDDKLEEIMSKYRENQAMASKMFEERKRDMTAKPVGTEMPYIKPGDENSKYYTRPDEAPVSHPADIIERLQKENPEATIEELVKEADAIVAHEIEERKKAREDLDTIKETGDDIEQNKLNEEDNATEQKKLEEELEEQKKADEQKKLEEELEEQKKLEEELEEQKKADEQKKLEEELEEQKKADEFNSRMADDVRRKSTDQARKKKKSGGLFSKMFSD